MKDKNLRHTIEVLSLFVILLIIIWALSDKLYGGNDRFLELKNDRIEEMCQDSNSDLCQYYACEAYIGIKYQNQMFMFEQCKEYIPVFWESKICI